MIIDQLPAIASPQAADEIPIERGTTTYKIRYDDFGQPLQDQIDAIETDVGDVSNLTTAATNCVDAINEVKTNLNNLCLQSAVVTVSGNGTTSHTLTGLTANHVIDNWGMFTDSACTTPIPENAPTADITITPGANSWTLLIENFSSTFYMKPTFILPQN